jgi:mersacidin/lichenicidin family type 2 lantibiotic
MIETENIIRAWKDDDYRLSLSIDEQRSLPANPAGMVELSPSELAEADKGHGTFVTIWIFWAC